MTYLARHAGMPADLVGDTALSEQLMRPALLAAALVVATGSVLAWPTLSEQFIETPRVNRVLDSIQASPDFRAAIALQNEALAGQSQAEIDAFDSAWVAEGGDVDAPLIRGHLELPASAHLRRIVAESGGAVGHAILMDNRGRNVAIARPTHDFWQGDEAKWRETFLKGARAEHRSTPEVSHDARFVACWVSRTISEPRTGEPIGAVAIEVNASRAGARFCSAP
jgi:hypothetical protein